MWCCLFFSVNRPKMMNNQWLSLLHLSYGVGDDFKGLPRFNTRRYNLAVIKNKMFKGRLDFTCKFCLIFTPQEEGNRKPDPDRGARWCTCN